MSAQEIDDASDADVFIQQSADESGIESEQDESGSEHESIAGGEGNGSIVDEQQPDDETSNKERPKKKVRKLKLAATQDFNTTLSKRGILYLSRIPPRMGPSKVKSLLSDFGPISRIYLVEEDKVVRKKRRKAGGSGCKRYTEGWVEFESKKVAKRVGETLNMTRVTNHKRSLHYDDLWNVKVS